MKSNYLHPDKMSKVLKVIFFLIILSGVILRFYNLRNNTQFDYDQENSIAFAAKNILVDRHFTLIGPVIGTHDLFLGPMYSYLESIFFLALKMDPIAGALSAAVLTTISILIGIFALKKTFGWYVASIFGVVWSTSSFIIDLDRTPWNPNLLALSSLLVFIGMFRLQYEKNRNLPWILLGIGLFIGVNSHFTVFLLCAVIVVFISLHPNLTSSRALITALLLSTALMPLVIFNFKHDSLLQNNILHFLQTKTVTNMDMFSSSIDIGKYILETIGRMVLFYIPSETTQIAGFLFLGSLLAGWRTVKYRPIGTIFLIYFGVYCAAFTLYNGSIPNYYFLGLLPVALVYYSFAINSAGIGKSVLFSFVIFVSLANIYISYASIRNSQAYSLDAKQKIVSKIKSLSMNKPVKIMINADVGRNFGFDYLVYYYGINRTQDDVPEQYVIYLPASRVLDRPDYIYGDIALIKLRTNDHN